MRAVDKKTGRPVKMSREQVLAKLQEEARARREEREAREDAGLLEPWEIPVPFLWDYDPDLDETSATSADARLITLVMISGEEMELLVQPNETIRALAKRFALIKGVGKVRLLVGHTPVSENLFVLDCVPHASVVTAILQCGFDFPNRLDSIVEQQIRISCELHGAGPGSQMSIVDPEAFWTAAFEKPNWHEFARHIGTQDFQIRVFSFGLNPSNQTRYIWYNFGMGDNGFGSVHAENESSATAIFDDGTFELYRPRRATPERFLTKLEEAARAKHGVDEFGAW
jgi:hypothetical protein